MSNIAAKTSSNVSVKGCSNPSLHTGMKLIIVEELKKELLRRGCYVTDNMENLIDF